MNRDQSQQSKKLQCDPLCGYGGSSGGSGRAVGAKQVSHHGGGGGDQTGSLVLGRVLGGKHVDGAVAAGSNHEARVGAANETRTYFDK